VPGSHETAEPDMSPLLVVGHWLHHVDSTLALKSEAARYRDLTAIRSSLREKRPLPLTCLLQWLHCTF
jgi:hypothetical protein